MLLAQRLRRARTAGGGGSGGSGGIVEAVGVIGGSFSANVDTSEAVELTASSQYSSVYVPQNAFDGVWSRSNAWISDNNNLPNPDGSCWIQWEFVSPISVKALRIKPRPVRHGNPTDFLLKFSNAGSFTGEEILVVSFAGLVSPPNNNTPMDWCEVPDPVPALFMRMEIHAYDDSEDYGWTAIGETDLYKV
jgi:hypothetical protein